MNFNNFFVIYKKRINQALKNFLAPFFSKKNILSHAIKNQLFPGGKRIRPLLVYAIGEMLKVKIHNLDIPAAAIECMHTYSLIHDDLPSMDNDKFRRGKLTCHAKYGENIAILAGNCLQSLSFSILSDQSMPDVNNKCRIAMISELSKASGIKGMCNGQAYDLFLKKKKITISDLEKIYFYKTGALIHAAINIGMLSAEEKRYHVMPLLKTYAHSISLAFQLVDDILDKDQDTFGTKKNKITYPKLVGIKKTYQKIRILHETALETLEKLSSQSFNTNLLKNIVNFIVMRKK
ncbi:(2E,6E)-farnesyl diphosphate synthase [Candidatus Tachikawaea gelatinosa]|uniref:Polyprenyl synthetase n=1 Tax=Candidatus Tachikawaea gelatinosa TaxID=1410383 RepID=A0A090AQX9_9ENTR|nr:(2E,6E)-farnesyl diphosphate synthase [Candidatus Tachikawaea gelatinosa]BAP58757.1 polyprenyl synthetase [Candidatus Tachikawaea gelatinosa]